MSYHHSALNVMAAGLVAGAFGFANVAPAQGLKQSPDDKPSSSTCKKPVGTFVGGAAGDTFISGSLYGHASLLFSLKFNADGSGTFNMIPKTTNAPSPPYKYSASATWTAANHTLDAASCTGMIVDNNGTMRAYVVGQGGNIVDMMDYSESPGIMTMIFHLNKA